VIHPYRPTYLRLVFRSGVYHARPLIGFPVTQKLTLVPPVGWPALFGLKALGYALWDSDLERLVPFRFAAVG
jgi:hypothetical protein